MKIETKTTFFEFRNFKKWLIFIFFLVMQSQFFSIIALLFSAINQSKQVFFLSQNHLFKWNIFLEALMYNILALF